MRYDDKEIVHIKNGDIEYIEFKVLNSLNVKNCITLRHGGVSSNERKSLNFRTLGKDNIENVFENLRRIKKEVGFSDIYKATQSHTDKVIDINSKNKEEYEFHKLNRENADGYIVNEKNIATLITTADCNPVIIFDKKNRVIANVHAGWRGVVNKIYINAINKMVKEYNSDIKDIIVCIGPSIRSCHFTSQDEDFKHNFTDNFKYEDKYLKYEEDNITYHIDLIEILKTEFKRVGVNEENIHIANICTVCNSDDFFSYRKSMQEGYDDYGTMATIVEIM